MRTEAVTYKSLYPFYAAALSLLGCGILFSEYDHLQTILLLCCCFCGVFGVYRLNDFIDSEWNLRNNLHFFFKDPVHVLFMLLFVGIIIPLALMFLPRITFVLLGLSGIIGALYSLKFRMKGYVFRIKNTFILKNVCIGAIWGGLVPIGGGGLNHPLIFPLFLFAFAQVFIGSSIRDIPDVQKDVHNAVKTLPTQVGEQKTIVVLAIINFFSILAFYDASFFPAGMLVGIPVIIWRSMNLFQLYRHPYSQFWGQAGNLLTCFFIFLFSFLSTWLYDF